MPTEAKAHSSDSDTGSDSVVKTPIRASRPAPSGFHRERCSACAEALSEAAATAPRPVARKSLRFIELPLLVANVVQGIALATSSQRVSKPLCSYQALESDAARSGSGQSGFPRAVAWQSF